MDFFQAVVIGVVEGVTEFLPISSTGHMILTADFLSLEVTEFVKTFEIVIQLGAILAVLVLYWKSLFLDKKIFLRVVTAFIPTAIIGLVFYKIVKDYLLGSSVVVLWALGIGGLALILFEYVYKEKEELVEELDKITFKQALAIGVFQALAIVPGVSRAAATIVGGLVMGLKRRTIVEFSFLLAVPTMAAASGLDLLQTGFFFTGQEFLILIVGFLVAFLVALVVVGWLLRFIKNHTFVGFGWYRIGLAIVFALFLLK